MSVEPSLYIIVMDDDYIIRIRTCDLSEEDILNINRYMKDVLGRICHEIPGVDFLVDIPGAPEGIIFFNETGVGFRPPPGVVTVYQDILFSSSPWMKNISSKEVKILSGIIYEEFNTLIASELELLICLE